MTHTVLIVDDSLTVRMDLADAFTAAGFRPVPCATAAEARATLMDGNVDAIVLDVLLPDANGVDLLHEIRATPGGSNVSVVMLSSEVEIADRIRGLRTGADEYVGKPYDADHLVAKVEKLVRASRALPSAPSITADVEDARRHSGAAGRDAAALAHEAARRSRCQDTAGTEEDTGGGRQADVSVHTGGCAQERGLRHHPGALGGGALALLAVQEVDCILMDVQMPG